MVVVLIQLEWHRVSSLLFAQQRFNQSQFATLQVDCRQWKSEQKSSTPSANESRHFFIHQLFVYLFTLPLFDLCWLIFTLLCNVGPMKMWACASVCVIKTIFIECCSNQKLSKYCSCRHHVHLTNHHSKWYFHSPMWIGKFASECWLIHILTCRSSMSTSYRCESLQICWFFSVNCCQEFKVGQIKPSCGYFNN